MRHGKKFNALGRKTAHRGAMLSNMATSLIMHKRINTTVAKAKALRVFVEPVLTRSKTDSTHNRREAFKMLRNKHAVIELFSTVGPKIGDRPGGYVRIIKTGTRLGDAAEMAMVELVDFNETMLAGKKTKTRRSRRGGGKKTTAQETATEDVKKEAAATEAKAEEPKAEKPIPEETKAKEEPKAEAKAEAAEKKTDEPEAKEQKGSDEGGDAEKASDDDKTE